MLHITILAATVATGMLGAYYSVTTWLSTFSTSERHLSVEHGGYFDRLINEAPWPGYLTSAWLSDTWGVAAASCCSPSAAALLILAYTPCR